MIFDPVSNAFPAELNPFKSISIPRPIGWISTVNREGVHNVAPFSQVMNLTFDPPYIAVGINEPIKRKDTCVNIEETGEFVYNVATYDLRKQVDITSLDYAPDEDEFEIAGLTKVPAVKIKPCLIGESPISMECVYHSTVRIPGNTYGTFDLIIARVVMIHIKDEFLMDNGKIDVLKIRPLCRLGYHDYSSIESIFEMKQTPKTKGFDGLSGTVLNGQEREGGF